ncbi:MAG: dihydrolipoyl dehydrogenase [Clostridiaceae bacterium]|nr:dihydrolipoyl dehydrogenase [Clostridiaceae bacterium]
MKTFDIIVIGSGAGLVVAEAALMGGMSCAIIEKSKFGGTCLTKGCIPSKMLVYPSDLVREAEKGHRVGIGFSKPVVDWEKISKRMWDQINHSIHIEKSLKRIRNLEVYKGTAEFTGKKTLQVKYDDNSFSEEIQSDLIIIATGAESYIPPIKDIEKTGYITYETFFGDKFPKKPWKSLIIVGGGAIGTEFAHVFSAFGTKVTIVEMKPRILSSEEEEISNIVEAEFENNGITVLTNSKVIASDKKGDIKTLIVENTVTGERKQIEAEEIFIASGLKPNTDTLKISNTDVKTDEKGWIITNEYLETSQKGIYALGDINGKYQFRHKANYEAEILINNLFTGREKRKAFYNAVPWAIFTCPQVAHVGMTEAEAKNSGKKYWVGRNYYSRIAGGIALGITDDSTDNGFVKIIAGENSTILGVHIVGPHAAILLQPFVYLMNVDYRCERRQMNEDNKPVYPPLGSFMPINNSMVIHPSLSELTAWAIGNIEWD